MAAYADHPPEKTRALDLAFVGRNRFFSDQLSIKPNCRVPGKLDGSASMLRSADRC